VPDKREAQSSAHVQNFCFRHSSADSSTPSYSPACHYPIPGALFCFNVRCTLHFWVETLGSYLISAVFGFHLTLPTSDHSLSGVEVVMSVIKNCPSFFSFSLRLPFQYSAALPAVIVCLCGHDPRKGALVGTYGMGPSSEINVFEY
jgi:hypothetical protein